MYEETPRTDRTNPDPNTAEKDRAAGDLNQAKGRVKESVGALTGDEHLKAEGEADQMAGATRSRKGQWKQRVKAWIDRL
ncbi:MAG: CsbD family protein [Chloroflexi bacterium]|nr:CsbD family protein [Chloroflexota bacterium]